MKAMQISRRHWRTLSLEIALILILTSSICFLKAGTIILYLIMNIMALVIVGMINLKTKGFVIQVTDFHIWLSILYALFFLYGMLFLRAGVFNADKLAVMYIQCIALYSILYGLFKQDDAQKRLARCCSITAIICMILLYVQEGASVFSSDDFRLGNSLSGNSNSVAMSLGILSVFISDYFGKVKKFKYIFLVLIISLFMLATGSKKAMLYLLLDLVILYTYSKNKVLGFIKVMMLIVLLVYLTFFVDIFYNTIGFRIIDMLGSLGVKLSNAHFSYSTSIRMFMLNEAFDFWKDHPIFGGGMNYFLARTQTTYEYCHSNIMELLCNMGLVGLIAYYIPYLDALHQYKQLKKWNKHSAWLVIGLISLGFITGWMAVSFSESCISYLIPIYFYVMKRISKEDEIYAKNKNIKTIMEA